MVKILIGLVGAFILGFSALEGFEAYKWETRCHLGKEKSHDVLERGEDAVLKYLTNKGWTDLEIYRNDILSFEGEEGILEAEAVITGKKKGNGARLVMRYGLDLDCEVYGITVLEKKSLDW